MNVRKKAVAFLTTVLLTVGGGYSSTIHAAEGKPHLKDYLGSLNDGTAQVCLAMARGLKGSA